MITLLLSNVPAISFLLAVVIALLRGRPFAQRLLDWLLLLPIGVGYTWAGIFHVFFPDIAAQSIGWQVSPFEFEIGVADMAIGITAIISFWQRLPFKAAVVIYIVLFNLGVTVGHLRDAMAGNLAANNFGLLLVITIAELAILPLLLYLAARDSREPL